MLKLPYQQQFGFPCSMTQACTNGDQPSCSKWLLSTMTIAYNGGGVSMIHL